MYSIFSDLHHGHVHTVFRVAQNAPNAPVLYDLWTGDSLSPELEAPLKPDYWSLEDSETQVYKSPLVECSWDLVTTVSTKEAIPCKSVNNP